jgi:hypothetical protein
LMKNPADEPDREQIEWWIGFANKMILRGCDEATTARLLRAVAYLSDKLNATPSKTTPDKAFLQRRNRKHEGRSRGNTGAPRRPIGNHRSGGISS